MEASLNSIIRLVVVVAGLALMLHVPPSWGQSNTALGGGALGSVTTGFDNSAFGLFSLGSLTTGSENTAAGTATLIFSNGVLNTAIGSYAGWRNVGNRNTAIGGHALSGPYSLEITPECGNLNTLATGSDNTASGYNALQCNFTGGSNTASGVNALRSNIGGNFNTASGTNALYYNQTGGFNTAVGGQALFANVSGSNNTAIGINALGATTIGSSNTAIGTNALLNSTGNKNIAIGFESGINLTTGSNNIYIGSVSGVAGGELQTIRVGKAQTRTFVAGIGTANVAGVPVLVDGNGQLGVAFSSGRYKRDIENMASRSEGLLKLRPVTFSYKDETASAPHYGLIAEEVATVYPELVTRTAAGEVQGVKYHELIPMLLNELQRQQRELSDLAMLRKELAELRALVGQGRETASLSQ